MEPYIFDLRIKIISKFWKLLNVFFKGKHINFSVFHLFGENCFIQFLSLNLELTFIYFEEISVKKQQNLNEK